MRKERRKEEEGFERPHLQVFGGISGYYEAYESVKVNLPLCCNYRGKAREAQGGLLRLTIERTGSRLLVT